MSDEFAKRERGLPSKDVRYAQGHETNPHAVEDSRWTPASAPHDENRVYAGAQSARIQAAHVYAS